MERWGGGVSSRWGDVGKGEIPSLLVCAADANMTQGEVLLLSTCPVEAR